MKIIGLTGGIGSGKTKILNVFKAKGVPCYEADLASRKLIDSDPFLISEIKKIFIKKLMNIYHVRIEYPK